MWMSKQFPWQLAQLRKKVMDPIAEFWEEWRSVWNNAYDGSK